MIRLFVYMCANHQVHREAQSRSFTMHTVLTMHLVLTIHHALPSAAFLLLVLMTLFVYEAYKLWRLLSDLPLRKWCAKCCCSSKHVGDTKAADSPGHDGKEDHRKTAVTADNQLLEQAGFYWDSQYGSLKPQGPAANSTCTSSTEATHPESSPRSPAGFCKASGLFRSISPSSPTARPQAARGADADDLAPYMGGIHDMCGTDVDLTMVQHMQGSPTRISARMLAYSDTPVPEEDGRHR